MFNRLKNLLSSSGSRSSPAGGSGENTGMPFAITASSIGFKNEGDAFMRCGEMSSAAQRYEQALALSPSYAEAHANLGFVLAQQGRFAEAEASLRQALALNPEIADAQYFLGTVHRAQDKQEQAAGDFAKALAIDPASEPAWSALCLLYIQTGKTAEAGKLLADGLKQLPDSAELHCYQGNLHVIEARYGQAIASFRHALSLAPDHVQAWANLGLAQLNGGDANAAALSLQRLVDMGAATADVFNNLGIALHRQSEFAQAIAAYERGVLLDPQPSKIRCNLGISLQAAGNIDAAIGQYHALLSLDPQYDEARFNLACALQAKGETAASVECYRAYLSHRPDNPDAHNNLGNALHALGEAEEALSCFDRAVALRPDDAAGYYGKGNILRSLGRLQEAQDSYANACEKSGEMFDAHVALADVQYDLGKLEQARTSYLRASAIRPHDPVLRWILAVMEIPALPASDEDVQAGRLRWIEAMEQWRIDFAEDSGAKAYQAVGAMTPFYIAYQEVNNRTPLAAYGELCAQLMSRWQLTRNAGAPMTKRSGTVKLGIVSAHISSNSVWNAIVKGWFQHLNPQRIELHVFHLSARQDGETAWARSRATGFFDGTKTFEQWVDLIEGAGLDAIIYPEIGMDRLTTRLAALRLAPVQAVSWGHPETSGLPSVDYFLSAQAFEPDAAQDNYAEKLVCLPGLGCHYQPEQIEEAAPDYAALSLDPALPVLLCPGAPFKYAPKFDYVLCEIAQRIGQCQLVFFASHAGSFTDQLRSRLQTAFGAMGMRGEDYCRFIPWLDKAAFHGLMKRADVMLDTIGFSGFNTAIQAMECGLPIVTREGRFMRGRLASGILRQMGLPELVAQTEMQYVDLAARLVQDAQYNKSMRQRIVASRSDLFADAGAVLALENFLVERAQRAI